MKYLAFLLLLTSSGAIGETKTPNENFNPEYRRKILDEGSRITNIGDLNEGSKYFYYGIQNWQHPSMREDLVKACKHLFANYYVLDLHKKHEKKLKGCPKSELNYLYGRVDRPYAAMAKYGPKIPKRAYKLQISGSVTVEYTITESGTVKDVVIVESSNKLFNKSAMVAARKFRYLPKVEGGKTVEVRGVRNIFTYQVPVND